MRIWICSASQVTCVSAVFDTAVPGERTSIHRCTTPLSVTCTGCETSLLSGSPSAKVSVSVGPTKSGPAQRYCTAVPPASIRLTETVPVKTRVTGGQAPE